EVVSKRNHHDEEMNFINHSFLEELNIYNHAQLYRDSALKKAYVIEKSSTEIGAIFELSGELKGSIVCLVDLFNNDNSTTNISYFRSLFLESMNILLGSFLTNLEELSHIMSLTSAPKHLATTDPIPGAIADNLAMMKVWS